MQNSTYFSFRSENRGSDAADAKAEMQALGLRTAPGKNAVRNILAFSKAMEVKNAASGLQCEVVLN
jgi:hypothetical protein